MAHIVSVVHRGPFCYWCDMGENTCLLHWDEELCVVLWSLNTPFIIVALILAGLLESCSGFFVAVVVVLFIDTVLW